MMYRIASSVTSKVYGNHKEQAIWRFCKALTINDHMLQSDLPEPALSRLKLLTNSLLAARAMDRHVRDWVTLGLIFTTHPRMKAPDQGFPQAPGPWVERLLERVEIERTLRPSEGR